MNCKVDTSAPGPRWPAILHLQVVLKTPAGNKYFYHTIAPSRRRSVENSDAFSLEFENPFLQSDLTALGDECRPTCVDLTMQCLLAVAAVCERQPKIAEDNVLEGLYGARYRAGSNR